MLDHTWKLKRQTGNAVSTSNIDILYEKGIKAGALGGKITWCRWRRFLSILCATRKTSRS